MASQQGVVISVGINLDIKKQDGVSTYKGWELIYKNTNGEVKTLQKPIQGLKYNPALKTSLESLKAGDEFTVSLEKNQGGFWDVKSIEKGFVDGSTGEPAKSVSSQSGGAVAKPAAANGYVQRDFESKDERLARQKLIVRQSSISNAIEVLSIGAETSVRLEEVFDVAQKMVDFVYEGTPRQLSDKAILEMEDDIPE